MPPPTAAENDDQDWQKGAVEDDRPAAQPPPGKPGKPDNPDAPGLNDQGLPNDPVAIGQDRIGANEDDTQG